MSTARVLEEVERLLAILGRRWEERAQPVLVITPYWASIDVAHDAGELAERMDLVDQAARWLRTAATPQWGSVPDVAMWGVYGTPRGQEAGRLNGVRIVVHTGITAAEMNLEAVAG